MVRFAQCALKRHLLASLPELQIVDCLMLGEHHANESAAVDARQELDLKVGVVFTRMLTRALRDAARRRFALPSLRLLSFGPCQTPTLW